MQKKTKPHKIHHVVFWVFDAFSNHCLANTLEPLRAANAFCGYDAYSWSLASAKGGSVVSSSGLDLATQPIGDLTGDVLIVMPSYNVETYATPTVARMLRGAAKRFKDIVGLDTGAWLLADAELLDGKTATIHWDVVADFAQTFPKVHVSQDRFVVDGRFGTCGGAARAFDWVTQIIGARHGLSIQLQVIDLFQGQKSSTAEPIGLKSMVAIMRQNIETPLPLPAIAGALGISAKTLERKCKAELGQTAGKIYQQIRLNHIRDLLKTGRIAVGDAAARAGYSDPAAMTRAFKKVFGTTPRQIRPEI